MDLETLRTILIGVPNFVGFVALGVFAWKVINLYHAIVLELLKDRREAEARARFAEANSVANYEPGNDDEELELPF